MLKSLCCQFYTINTRRNKQVPEAVAQVGYLLGQRKVLFSLVCSLSKEVVIFKIFNNTPKSVFLSVED